MWCNFRINLHKSWFSHSYLSIQDACRFLTHFLMIRPLRQPFLMEELNMQSHTVVDRSNLCREVFFINFIFLYIDLFVFIYKNSIISFRQLCLDWLKDNSEMLGKLARYYNRNRRRLKLENANFRKVNLLLDSGFFVVLNVKRINYLLTVYLTGQQVDY